MTFDSRYDQPDTPPLSFRNLPKRHPVLFPLGIFVLLLVGFGILGSAIQKPLIGVIKVEGVILESEPVIKKLIELERNPEIKAIILRINCPGGAVAPSQEIFSELLRIRQRIKVYSSLSSLAASGCYYIAAGTDKIFANPGTLTGSIGVIMQSFNIKELMDKIGIRPEVVKSGKNKDLGSLYRDMKPKERKLLQDLIDDTHQQFVADVAKGRNLDPAFVSELADGRIFTGNKAKDLGLVDELGGFRQTLVKIRSELGLTEDVELYYPGENRLFNSDLGLDSLLNLKDEILLPGLYYLQ